MADNMIESVCLCNAADEGCRCQCSCGGHHKPGGYFPASRAAPAPHLPWTGPRCLYTSSHSMYAVQPHVLTLSCNSGSDEAAIIIIKACHA